MSLDPWSQWPDDGSERGRLAVAARAVVERLAIPGRPAHDLERFCAAAGPDCPGRLLADPPAIELLLALAGISRYGFEVALRDPELFWELVGQRQYRQVWGRRTLTDDLQARLGEGTDFAVRRSRLARFKERHYLRLILGDISGAMGFEALVGELSDVTDVLVQAAIDLERERLAPRHGLPPTRFVVLGMGKLGGRELNYSSDIDLIFAFEDGGPPPGVEEWDCHAYCQRLGAGIIRILDEATDDGRLFRVDMRLRPEGDKGELALSLRETVDYYYSVGRAWERQAMIKARPIAGDLALGERLLGELAPWIYPQEQVWEDLENTRTMRRRIEERRAVDDVKAGAGGIRDIEFLAQFFQLSHGGRISELRNRASLPTLRALADLGIIPGDSARELERHYLWLRMVEHRLQMWGDRQVHDLPRAVDERAALARRCGLRGEHALAQFDQRMEQVRGRVRLLAERHYLNASREQDAALALLAQDEIEPALAEALLGKVGFKDVQRAAQLLRKLAAEPFFLLSRSRTERSLAALMPALLALVRESPDPDQTLDNFHKIVSAVGGRSTFYQLMLQQPKVLRLFVDLAGWAGFLVALLHEVPGLPDDLVDTLNQPMRHRDILLREARGLVRGLQDPAQPLRHFHARELCATAVRDLEGLPQAQVNRQISDLAIAILNVVLDRCVAERAREWGLPMDGGRPCRFAILGLGKLGSRELSYASDMDVIFVCDPGGTCLRNQRGGEEFWTRVAQDVMRVLGEARLYEIDPRLRPWGEQGELVANLPAVHAYWAQPRDLWERMAMLRIAHLAGHPGLGEECAGFIRATALDAPLPGDAARQVIDMRARLEESVAGRDHLKRGRGGYVDHEFIAHYLSLGMLPERLPVGAAIGETLRRLASLGRLPPAAAEELVRGLDLLRFVEARMRLTAGKAISSIPTTAGERTELARRCGFADLAAFDLALHDARQQARTWFERLIV